MRRRKGHALTADQTLAIYERAQREAQGMSRDAERAHVDRVLTLHNTDAIKALRARRWIRLGRPASFDWDE